MLLSRNLAVLRANEDSAAHASSHLCDSLGIELFFTMPTEASIPDAEDLKSRVCELRRFL